MKRMVQIALISLFCLTLAAPAMAVGTNGIGTNGQGNMTGTSNNVYGNAETQMNDTGVTRKNLGTNGLGTLDVNNDNDNDNDRTGVRARNYRGGNVRGFATTDTTNNTNWSWLGLLGLLGLAGMFNRGKDRDRSKI